MKTRSLHVVPENQDRREGGLEHIRARQSKPLSILLCVFDRGGGQSMKDLEKEL